MEKDLTNLCRHIKTLGILCLVLLSICIYAFYNANSPSGTSQQHSLNDSIIKHVNQFTAIPFQNDAEGELAAYGEKLINHTYDYFFENGKKIGNNLACTNCHLNGGTKAFAAPYVGLQQVFPTYIARENKIESLEERINGCFERSMNGRAIPENSHEMRAMITYIKKISRNTANTGRLEGQGFVKIDIPTRAADLKKGALVFTNHCVSCHGEDGAGQANKETNGYLYPPLWGQDSYNDGAGMSRLLTAARFIKANMPLGVTYDEPILTDEEAYDVAAYINSFDRPSKLNKEKDYPDLTKKPIDSPYPPYADGLSQQQHKYGPYKF